MKRLEYLPMELPDGPALLFGYTPMCGTCKVAGRMVELLPHLLDIPILKIDLNFTPEFTQQHQIMSVPVLMLVVDGVVIETIYRFESVTNLYEIIMKYLTTSTL